MNLQQFLTMLLMARGDSGTQSRGAPMGRAGGINPALPQRPIAGVSTGMGAPVMQQDFGAQPPAPVVNRDVGIPGAGMLNEGSLQPGGLLYEGGREASQLAAQQPQIQPFNPPPLDPGMALPPQGLMGGLEAESMGSLPRQNDFSIGVGPMESWQDTGGPQSEPITDTYRQQPPLDLGVLPHADLESQLMQQQRTAHERLFEQLLRRQMGQGVPGI